MTPSIAFDTPVTELGYTYRLFDASSAPPIDELARVIEQAWSWDYRNKAILRFDHSYLLWLMKAESFFGVWVTTEAGEPAGCELALVRTLFSSGRYYRTCYVTLLSVAPPYRGRGIAQRILGYLSRAAFEIYRGELIVSAFDRGAAGEPTVRKSVAQDAGGSAIHVLPPLRLWGCAYDLLEMDRYERLSGAARIALLPPLRKLVEAPSRVGRRIGFSPGPKSPVRPSEVESAFAFGFVFDHAIASLYPEGLGGDSGTLSFDFPDGSHCFFSYHISTLMKEGLSDRKVGQIQLVFPGTASPLHLRRALRSVNRALSEAGCLGSMIMDTGALSKWVLLGAGYFPTDRTIHFSIRGPSRVLGALSAVKAPFFVDLT